MIKPASMALCLLVLAGCTTLPDQPSKRLVGVWLEMSGGVEHPWSCASGLPIVYEADGRYVLFEEEGVWRLSGDVLTETATVVTDAGDPARTEIGVPYVSSLRWRGRDHFVKTLRGGERLEFRRCPEMP